MSSSWNYGQQEGRGSSLTSWWVWVTPTGVSSILFHFSSPDYRVILHTPQMPPSHGKFSFIPCGFLPLSSPPSQHPFFSPRS